MLCPAHISAAPPAPLRPHDPTTEGLECFTCRIRLASTRGRQVHHCGCCGERFTTCRDTQGRGFAICPNCPGTSVDSAEVPHRDPLADLLQGVHEADSWARMLASARQHFGELVADYLVPVAHRDRAHTYARLSVDAHRLDLRCALGFEAATSAPCDECSAGRLWTPVRTRADLLGVHLHGAGADTRPCDHPQYRQLGVGPERTSRDHLRL